MNPNTISLDPTNLVCILLSAFLLGVIIGLLDAYFISRRALKSLRA